MDIDTHIARIKDLITKREAIDAELAAMFGIALKPKKNSRCSRCGEEGHNAKTCPTQPQSATDAQTSGTCGPTSHS